MRRRVLITVILLLGISLAALLTLRRPDAETVVANQPFALTLGARDGFATSMDCQSCHPDQHTSWHASFHRTMTQLASPDTVVAPFDGVSLADYRQTAELERRDDEFWVRMIDHEPLVKTGVGSYLDDLPRVDRKVVMTTGSHHFQAYWTQEKDGTELWLFPWRYHIASKRWIHRRDVFVQPPVDVPEIHHKIWNGECIDCHSTGGRPGLDPTTSTFATQVAELGIACEACHGPAQQHVALAVARRESNQDDQPDDWKIVNPANLDARKSTQVCGQCHSDSYHLHDDHLAVGKRYVPGQDMGEHLRLTRLGPTSDPAYWADGVCRAGGREFNALVRSDCHLYGSATCLSCHSMHNSDPNDQLLPAMHSNEACFQCHEGYRGKLEEHTHHKADSAGSLCYSCHMPHTSFALLKGIRNHNIQSPKIESIVPDGQPNACNLCHLDKTLAWSAEKMTDWYEQPPVELSDDESNIAASLLWLLRGDGAQRVVASWHMGWESGHEASGADWIAPHLAQALDDDYPAVRWVAAESLRKLPGFADFEYQYNADRELRSRSVGDAILSWSRGRDVAKSPGGEEVLLAPSGAPRSAIVERLLRQQDKRPVGILE